MRVFLMLLLHLTFTFKPPATSLPTSIVCYQGATTQQTRQTLRPGFVIFLRGVRVYAIFGQLIRKRVQVDFSKSAAH
uniref:Putative secreted peptide n=1 Tax=Anopheles braziliensis TaxID=58242 RepID=A0A2M3ZT72_9DIPT